MTTVTKATSRAIQGNVVSRWWYSFMGKVTHRNPNETLLRGQHQYLESMKKIHALFFGCGLVVGSIIYEQMCEPAIVKTPKLDGRSLVT